ARTSRGQVFSIEQDNLNCRHVAKSRQSILRKTSIQNLSILKINLLEQRTTNRLHHRTLNLVVQMHAIHDRTTLKTLHHALNPHASGLRLDRNLSSRRDVTSLFETTRNAAATPLALLSSPAKRVGSRFEHRLQTRVLDVLQPKRDPVHADELRQLIYVNFTR